MKFLTVCFFMFILAILLNTETGKKYLRESEARNKKIVKEKYEEIKRNHQKEINEIKKANAIYGKAFNDWYKKRNAKK